jgi:hypothetical protein
MIKHADQPAVDRAARLLLYEHIGELSWRIEATAATIQIQIATGDEWGALHSMSRLAEMWRVLAQAGNKLRALKKRVEASEKAQGEAIMELRKEKEGGLTRARDGPIKEQPTAGQAAG